MPSIEQFTFQNSKPENFSFSLGLGIWTERTKWHREHDELEWLEKEDPNPRAQEIARCRKEMIELVNDVSEEVYELSLRDLAELPRVTRESSLKEKTHKNRPRKVERKRLRTQGMESGGFLLKTFFPIPSPVKKRNSNPTSNGSSKSPKNLVEDGRKGKVEKSSDTKFVEKQQQQSGALFRRKCPRARLMMKGSANIILRNIIKLEVEANQH